VAEQTLRIGRRIAQARDAAGLTQAELATKIPGKADGTQVSKWERGVHRPGDDTLDQIAQALGKDIAWFLVSEPKPAAATPDLMGELSASASAAEQLAEVNHRLNRLQAVLEELAGQQVVAAALERLAQGEPPHPGEGRQRAA
jgi:transcriptional regulator with XRE-family HTH domain